MEKMAFRFTVAGERCLGKKIVSGVVGSGNLEVIVEENKTLQTVFHVQTAVENYKPIWKRVIGDFVKEYQPVGLKFTLADNGATPAVVSLRLRQALEVFQGYSVSVKNYLELGARQRINAIFDKGSFVEWLADDKFYSPHLATLNLPGQADDGIVIGSAHLNDRKILVAAQQKDFMGGAVGEIHGAKLTGLFAAAVKSKIHAVVILIDSGGVRLHEANAGEIAISETIRAIFEARNKGVMTIGVVCGKNGAFGGMGIISACFDFLLVNEIGRVGVSGPEVIQSVAGIEAFDAQDRALVWRVYGGKTRYLQDVAQGYVGSDANEIRAMLINTMDKKIPIDLASVKQRHRLLKKRLEETAGYQEEGQYLSKTHPEIATTIFDMNEQDFLKVAKVIKS